MAVLVHFRGGQLYIPGVWTIRQLLTNPKELFFPRPKHPDGSIVIWDEAEVLKMFIEDPVDLWVNSFGGSRSNFIVNLLEQGYRVRNEAHRAKGCHYIRPLDIGIKMGVFCFVDDLGVALTSQLNRGFSFNFDKLCDFKTDFSIDKWIENISIQIDNWTTCGYFPVVMINTDRISENSEKFKQTFGIEIDGFGERKTVDRHALLEPFEGKIDEVNRKIARLPDFGIINQ